MELALHQANIITVFVQVCMVVSIYVGVRHHYSQNHAVLFVVFEEADLIKYVGA